MMSGRYGRSSLDSAVWGAALFGAAAAIAIGPGMAAERAAASPFCASSPRAAWMSAFEVEASLKQLGLVLLQLRIADDRCYAAMVKDGEGHTRDLILHPVTAQIMRPAAAP